MSRHLWTRAGLVALLLLGGLGNARAQEAEPESEPSEGPVAGWVEDEGGFVLMSADGRHKLQFGFTGTYKLEPVLVEGEWQDRQAFGLLWPSFSGHLFKRWIRFFTSMELAGNPPYLLNAYVEFAPWQALGLRLGQMASPFSRHEWATANELLFPDWSVNANYFWSGYDKGGLLSGTVLDERLDWWVGLFGGSPIRQLTTVSGNFVVLGRVTLNPMGPLIPNEYPYQEVDGTPAPFRISTNLNAWYGKVQLTRGNFNPGTFSVEEIPTGETNRSVTLGADVAVQSRWMSFLTEGYWRRSEPEAGPEFDSWGVWGQLGFPLWRGVLDAGVRINYLDPSTDLSGDSFRSLEGQVGWYLWEQHLILRLRYGLAEQRSPGQETLGPVALPISSVGTVNVFTLQGVVAF